MMPMELIGAMCWPSVLCNAPHKAGLLGWLVAAGAGKEGLVRRERNSPGSQPPHKVRGGGLLGGRRTKPGSQTPKSLQGEGLEVGRRPQRTKRR